MAKFTVQFAPEDKIFRGEFKGLPREFLTLLKDKGFLERITPEFIEMMPETFDGEVNIDPVASTKDSYWIFFFLSVEATENMRIPTQEYLSRDIDINDDDGKLEFTILVPKDSQFVEKADNQEIIFNFFRGRKRIE